MSSIIRVELDHGKSDKTWHPGDLICGRVVYHSQMQMDINSISVTFEGKMRTEHVYDGTTIIKTVRPNVILSSHKMPLFQGPYTLLPTTKEWQFQFQLPTDCGEAQGLVANLNILGSTAGSLLFNPTMPNRLLNQERSQQLPPTIDVDDGAIRSRSTDNHCYICYRITAEIELPGTPKDRIAQFVNLKVQPYCSLSDYNSRIVHKEWKSLVVIKSYHLDPKFETRSLPIKEKLKSAMGAKSVPKVKIQFVIKQPSITLTSHMPAVIVGVSRSMDKDENLTEQHISNPEVIMTRYKIMLHPRTYQLVPLKYGMFDREQKVYTIGEEIVLFSWKGHVVLDREYDLRETRDRASTSPEALESLIPSFGSFIIAREYFLRLDVTIECLGQERRFGSTPTLLVVLPREGLPPNMLNHVDFIGEQLPSYESAVKSKPVF